ncbi:LOW QUALITY PROTEIN: hypothetical protein Cgig2_008467 [Carnegiea gigantea]|uniref:Uncharacterized protein n=1 Tax=Carnegiea gigantea TaxID=171969 RepID=A0A9Q1JUI9_9CARY|nr:LOW QUALITY PROTEIN: hypothetical protein Cgig2_008467 [Carnegiea gigantea]
MARHLKDEIPRSFNRNDYVDDEEEEDQLAHARYQSLEFAARLRVVKLELEKDQTRTKQSKVNSSWLKAAKNKMIKPFGSWISTCRKTVVDPVYTNSLLETIRKVGPDVRAPSDELSDIYLPEVAKEIKQWISKFPPKWKERGVTIMCNGQCHLVVDIEYKDDPQPKGTPPFRYSVDQQPQDIHGSECESEGHLSHSSSHDRSGGGGGGKGGTNEMGASYSSRPSTDYLSDRGRSATLKDDIRSLCSPNEQPRDLTHMEPIQSHGYPTDARYRFAGFQEMSSGFTGPDLFASSGGYDTYGGVLNNYGYSSTYTNCPPPIRHPDNPPIINQGTINYGDHHYYRQTFYSGDSTSSDQSWIDSTASSIFYQPQESYGVNQNNNDTYREPPRLSF